MPPSNARKRAASESRLQFTNFRNPSMTVSSEQPDSATNGASNAAYTGNEKTWSDQGSVDIPLERWRLTDESQAKIPKIHVPSPGEPCGNPAPTKLSLSQMVQSSATTQPATMQPQTFMPLWVPMEAPVFGPFWIPGTDDTLSPAAPNDQLRESVAETAQKVPLSEEEKIRKKEFAVQKWKDSPSYQNKESYQGPDRPPTPDPRASINKRPWEAVLAKWRTDWTVLAFTRKGYDEAEIREALKEFNEEQKGRDPNAQQEEAHKKEREVLAKLERNAMKAVRG